MNTRRFVCGSSVVLAGWLGATYLNDVPEMKYPKLDRKPGTAAAPETTGPDAYAAHVADAPPLAPQWR